MHWKRIPVYISAFCLCLCLCCCGQSSDTDADADSSGGLIDIFAGEGMYKQENQTVGDAIDLIEKETTTEKETETEKPAETQAYVQTPETQAPQTQAPETQPPAHTHSYSAVSVVAPTCTSEGYTVYACSCGDTYTGDYTGPSDHSLVSHTVEPTCTESGYTENVCSVCGYSYTDGTTAALGHDWKSTVKGDTVTHTCTRCGETFTEPF